jgi:hypothetical protein
LNGPFPVSVYWLEFLRLYPQVTVRFRLEKIRLTPVQLFDWLGQ